MPELVGEQLRIFELPHDSAVLIKGGAGTGKTLVAINRAWHLRAKLDEKPDLIDKNTKVCVIAYNKTLVTRIINMVAENERVPAIEVEVSTLHSMAYNMLNNYRGDFKIIANEEQNRVLNDAARAINSKYNAGFLKEEVAWLKGWCIATETEYLEKERTGRGRDVRVTQDDKKEIWKAFEFYNAELGRMHVCDFDDYILKALEITKQVHFQPYFKCLVVDEAQDFDFAQLTLITKLVSPNRLTIVMDAAQRIYRRGFSWRDLGISIVSQNSLTLQINYRNTQQIYNAALAIIKRCENTDEFIEITKIREQGEKPIVLSGQHSVLLDHIVDLVNGVTQQGKTVCFATPTRRCCGTWMGLLKEKGLKVFPIPDNRGRGNMPSVVCGTIHAIKGMEFDVVFLPGLTQDNLPYTPAGAEVSYLGVDMDTNRKLLYVAMTRAKSRLFLVNSGNNPTGFLAELIEANVVEEKTFN